MNLVEIEYLNIEPNEEYEKLINKVIRKCFEIQGLISKNLYVSVILTTPSDIKKINNEYRNIDKETDVLSFPMFEKDEIPKITGKNPDVLGDIVVSIEKVKSQEEEYGHSFERELAYMIVHGFFHLMGYDHIEEKDKIQMRAHEEEVLEALSISR